MKARRTRAFLVLIFVLFIQSITAQEEIYGARVYVNDATVSEETTLNYILEFPTVTVNDNDYLLITLPQEESALDVSGCNFVAGRAICEIQDGINVKSCQILTLQQAKITFNRVQGKPDSLKGSIRNFKNPDSSKPVKNIQLQLFSSSDQVRAVYYSGEINFFLPTSLKAALSSSSSIVGATEATLTVTITPSNILAGQGFVTVSVPEYYTNAGSDFMISRTSPTCSAQSTITVNSCTFENGSRLLRIGYRFKTGADSRAASSFYIENAFKNPITPEPKTGFIIATFDHEEYAIGESDAIALSGVTTANTFKYITFNFDRGSNVVGELNALQINMGMNLPLSDQCFIKFQFPDQLTLDENLYEASGNSFFTQAGTSSGKIPFYRIERTNGLVVVQACQVFNGADQVGSITFRNIQNPFYIASTDSFQIILATDAAFKNIVAQQTSGLTIDADEWAAGTITGSITAKSYLVSAQTFYSFSLTPPTSIDATTGSKITIQFSSLVSFVDSKCQLTNKQLLSSSVTCDVTEQSVTISNPFRSIDFDGGATIKFDIGTLINPISERDIGAITVETYVQIERTFYLVDQTTFTNQIRTKPGQVTPLEQINVSSYVTYDTDTVYIFKMSFEHSIPVGSSILASLPPGLRIFSKSLFQANCYRLDWSRVPIKLTCTVDNDSSGFSIQISSSKFGASGIAKNEEFRLQVTSIINPRTVGRFNQFYFASVDSLGNNIDISADNNYWNVKMNQISQMQLIQASAANGTNGAVTSYSMVFTVNTPVEDRDKLELRFPRELTLPSSTSIQCTGSQNLIRISCSKSTNNLVLVTLTNVGSIVAGQRFTLTFDGIRNSGSLRPTSSWSDILLSDFGNYDVSGYDDQVFVTNDKVSFIQNFELQQSTKEPDVQADYTIKFVTNNDIPYTGAIIVKAPSEVSIVRDKYRCFVITNSRRNNVCEFENNSVIKITDAFDNQPRAYSGTVEVTFVAQNPASNAETGISLEMIVYDSSQFEYEIDKITNGLNPLFVCSFPCETCDIRNPTVCLSCPQGKYQPSFLQEDGSGGATCQNACNQGFTYNALSTTKVCVPCDVSCKTCRVGGGATDSELCLTCADDFPLEWVQGNKCFPLEAGCPTGTYRQNKFACVTCTRPCLDCRGPKWCNYCDPFSLRPLLENRDCVNTCSFGFTPVYTGEERKGVCTACEAPCATCFDGLPEKCITCAEGSRQFLFGSQCLEACPAGTAIDLESKKCTGCAEGCKECSPKDNSICLVCKEGLSMLNSECYPECPPDYQKSSDGLACEPRQYPLDKFYAPFPFIGLLIIFYLVIFGSWLITKKDTLICQNMIAATSIVLVFCVIFQILAAMNQGDQPLTIVQGFIVLLANLIINVAYFFTFRVQIDDYKFNEYVKYNYIPVLVVNILVVSISLHTFRFVYGKLFSLPMFHAVTTTPIKFFKPLMYYSLIQIGCVAIPILLSNIYFAVITGSRNIFDNQLQCTSIELMIITVLMISLVLYERHYQHPRYINFRPEHDAINVFQSVFGSSKPLKDFLGIDSGSGGLGKANRDFVKQQEARTPIALQERLDRHKQLRQLLGVVRSNKDTCLNVHLDMIMDEEMRVQADKQESQPSPRLKPLMTIESQPEPDPVNFSWEGANEKWGDDGTEKRLKLLAWMECKMQEAAEKERLAYEKAQLKLRFQEKESMYDNQMFDNVFFSAKSKRDNEVQAEAILKTIGQQMSNTSLIDYKLKEAEEQEQKQTKKVAKKKAKAQAKLDLQRVKEVQTSEVEFKLSGRDSARSKQSKSSAAKQPIVQKLKLNEESSYSESSLTIKQKTISAAQSHQSSIKKTQSAKLSVLSKKTKSIKPEEDGPQPSPRSHKSKTSFGFQMEESVMFTEEDKSQPPLARPKKAMQPIPHKIQHSHDPDNDSLLGDELASKMVSEEKTLQQVNEIQKIDDQCPGPETKKWIKRVKLMKTLMLDCRDDSHFPNNRFLDEEQSESLTDRTQGGAKGDCTVNEVNIVEDLVESSDDYLREAMSSESTIIEQIIQDKQKPPDYQWQKININLTQRNFNIFSVLGNFPLDSFGRIINRRQVLEEMDYKDFDGLPVNERGYLINETTGAIYSKFTFEDLMMPITQSVDDYGELPMPFRLERFNFNPHKILGNFDFDVQTKKPIFLKNKFGQLTDKSYRPVNQNGFLINEQEDIVDNMGEVKFIKSMLSANGDLPMLFNYRGEQFKINEIIGQLKKDSASKEIICNLDIRTNRAIDELGRPVNACGYLIDKYGNIVNQKGETIWMFWELLHQEPPKLFSFTQWSLNWIKGNYDPKRVLGFDPKEDFLYDDDQRLINTEGYLIDRSENIIDYYGRIVFKNDLLNVTKGQDSSIPKIFTMGVLCPPQVDKSDDHKFTTLQQSSMQDNTTLNKSVGRSGMNLGKGPTSIFNLQDIESQMDKNSVNNQTGNHSNQHTENKHVRMKRHKKIKRQNSAVNRFGKKVLNLYQQYLDNSQVPPKQFSSLNQAETTGGQAIQPILVTPSVSRMRANNDYTSNSMTRILPQGVNSSDENPTRPPRNAQRFNSVANLVSARTPSAGVGTRPPRVRVNQFMRGHDEPSPIPMPRYTPVPDNSYAARVAGTFLGNTKQFLSREEDSEILGLTNNLRHNRNDSRLAISQQLDDIHSIYGKNVKKNRTQSDI